TKAEARGALPVGSEAVDPVELDGAERVDQVAEHAASADGGALPRVADEGKPPVALLSKLEHLGETRGRHHRSLVEDDRRAGGQVVAVVRWSVEAVLDEQLVERVRVEASVNGEHLGRRGRRRHTDDRSAVLAQVLDGGP